MSERPPRQGQADLPTPDDLAHLDGIELLAIASSVTKLSWEANAPLPTPEELALALRALDLAAQRGQARLAHDAKVRVLLAGRRYEEAAELVDSDLSWKLLGQLQQRIKRELEDPPSSAVVPLLVALARHDHWTALRPLSDLIDLGQQPSTDDRWRDLLRSLDLAGAQPDPSDPGDARAWASLRRLVSLDADQRRHAVRSGVEFSERLQAAVLDGQTMDVGELTDTLRARFAHLAWELASEADPDRATEHVRHLVATVREATNLVDLPDPLDRARVHDHVAELGFEALLLGSWEEFRTALAPLGAGALPAEVERWNSAVTRLQRALPLALAIGDEGSEHAISLCARLVGVEAALADAHGLADDIDEVELANTWSNDAALAGSPYRDRAFVQRLLRESHLRMTMRPSSAPRSAELISKAESIALEAFRAGDPLPVHAFLEEISTWREPARAAASQQFRNAGDRAAADALQRVVATVREAAAPSAMQLRLIEADLADDPAAVTAATQTNDLLRQVRGAAAMAMAPWTVPDPDPALIRRPVDDLALRSAINELVVLPPDEDRAAFELASQTLQLLTMANNGARNDGHKDLERWLRCTIASSAAKAVEAGELHPYDRRSSQFPMTALDQVTDVTSKLVATASGEQLGQGLGDALRIITSALAEDVDIRKVLAREAQRGDLVDVRHEARPEGLAPSQRLSDALQRRLCQAPPRSFDPADVPTVVQAIDRLHDLTMGWIQADLRFGTDDHGSPTLDLRQDVTMSTVLQLQNDVSTVGRVLEHEPHDSPMRPPLIATTQHLLDNLDRLAQQIDAVPSGGKTARVDDVRLVIGQVTASGRRILGDTSRADDALRAALASSRPGSTWVIAASTLGRRLLERGTTPAMHKRARRTTAATPPHPEPPPSGEQAPATGRPKHPKRPGPGDPGARFGAF